MHIKVWGDSKAIEDLKSSLDPSVIVSEFVPGQPAELIKVDAVFILKGEDFNAFGPVPNDVPVFIHSLETTLAEKKFPENYSRINAWPGFLSRQVWEVATHHPKRDAEIIASLGKKMQLVADDIGMISARIIGMIVNEAYFAFGEGISSKAEIDTAMKLGTNYPYGPFEWSKLIGLNYIASLLDLLSKNEKRYIPSASLRKEAGIDNLK